MPRTPFGEYIYSRRKSLRPPLTQRDIAERLTRKGFPHTDAAIAHWESQKKEIYPDFSNHDLIDGLAEILQTNPYKLREVAGFTKGIDTPLSPIESRFKEVFQLLPHDRQELYLKLMESEINLHKS